ncbi:unnamed protein product [Ascophyllum nodosum]
MGFSIAFTEIGNDMLLTETEKGSVFAAYYYGFALTQVPGGYMAKRFGGKAVLALSFLLWAPTSALMAIVSNAPDGVVAGVVTCRLAIGMAQGVFIPAAQSMLGHWIPPALRGRHFAFAMSGMYAGTAAAMVTVPTLVSSFGAASTFYGAACLGGLWLAIWLCTGSDAAAHGQQDEHEESGMPGQTATETILGRWLEEDRPKLDGRHWSTVGMDMVGGGDVGNVERDNSSGGLGRGSGGGSVVTGRGGGGRDIIPKKRMERLVQATPNCAGDVVDGEETITNNRDVPGGNGGGAGVGGGGGGIGGGGSIVVPKVTRMTRYAGAVPSLKVEKAKLKRGKRGNVSRNGCRVIASDSGIRGGGNGSEGGGGGGVIRSKVVQTTRDIEVIPALKVTPTAAARAPQRSPCDSAKSAAPFPWRKMIASPAAWACVAGNVGAGTATNVVISWLPSYYKDFIQVDLEEIGLVAQARIIFPHLTMMVFSVLGGMAYCWLTNDGGFSRAWASKTITGLSFFLALVVFLCMGLAKSPTMATLLTSLALASAATSRGGWSTNHVEIAAPEHAAILYSAANTVSAASSVLSISSTGKILDAFGDEGPARVWAWTAAMGSIGVVCAACGVFFVVFADSDKLLFPATYEEEGERDDAEREEEEQRRPCTDDWVDESPTSSMDPRILVSPMMT